MIITLEEAELITLIKALRTLERIVLINDAEEKLLRRLELNLTARGIIIPPV